MKALVTGAGARVGKAIAVALGGRSAQVAIHYRSSRSGAEETLAGVRAGGGDGVLLHADLADRSAARELGQQAVHALGGLDLLVGSAANFDRIALDDLDDRAWDRALHVNLRANYELTQATRAALKRARGSIVFLTCASVALPFRNYLPYVVSKGGLRTLMRTLALELAPEIRVNAIAPGTVLPPPEMPAQTQQLLASRVPLGRLGTPEDIARAVLFLADSEFVTGHEIAVDGGRTLAGIERRT